MCRSNVRFCVGDFSLEHLPAQGHEAALETFATLLAEVHAEGERVASPSGVFNLSLDSASGARLYDVLYNVDHEGYLNKDTRLALQQALNRCEALDDTFAAQGVDLSIGDRNFVSESVEFVIAMTKSNCATACLDVRRNDFPSGRQTVKYAESEVAVQFVTNAAEKTGFYQDVLYIEDLSESQFVRHAHIAYPRLHLVDGIDRQFRRFRDDYATVRPVVARHLAALNNHFRRLLDEYGNIAQVCKAMAAQAGIDISIESFSTRHNKAAMNKRKVQVGGAEVICELHTKLSPTHDRIYFYPGKAELVDNRIVIGIFDEHLPT